MGLSSFYSKRNPADILEEKVRETYKNTVERILRECRENEFLAGIMVQSAIASTYDALKQDKDLLLLSGLTELEYENMMERICKEILDIYLQ